ncbi:probable WRKY transcription factor 50 isoform X2 [Malania oleifera]|uniref:probable WRKY transcription factor 50 isoform X2 n=1 Tax=Malania oleifera TaxID=397392 RepID=UPI0025AE06A1|nr:probable WRKY transcription factor 50 isoform X2 [Malania oleifera]
MSDSSFGDPSEFELSEYFKLGDWLEEDSSPAPVDSRPTQNPVNHPYAVYEAGGSSSHREGPNTRVNGDGQDNRDVREKVAFKIKTDTDILDDGFKWRKYGKKMVKNSPNPS